MDKQDEKEERVYEVKKHEPEWRFLCSGIASIVLAVIAGVVLRIRSIYVIALILICMVVVGLCISFLRRNKELAKLKKRIVCFVMGMCVLIAIVLMFLFNGLHVHKWDPILIKDATCILKGEVIRECECGEVEIEVIPLTNHNWKDATCTEPKICMICEETEGEKLGHKEVILEGYAATCINDGLTDGKKCERCEAVFEEQKKIVALGHEEVVIKGYAATCTTTGLADGKECSRCDDVIKEQTEIKELGHKEITIKGYAATCTTTGLTDGKECSRCGATIEEQTVIKALGHKEVTLKGYAATCTTAGLTDGKECSRCGATIEEQTVIKALGHKEVTLKGYAATCTTAGLTDGKECSRCGVTIVRQTAINALGHKEVTLKGYEATCTEAGLTDGKECSRCGVTTKKQTAIKALGHNRVTLKGYVATCTTTGLTDGIQCSRCEDVITAGTTIEATGHKYDSDTDLTCNVCDHVRGYWSEYGAWSAWQDTAITPSSSRQVETDNYVVAGYNKKTQWFYSRYYGLHSDGFYRALPSSSGVCTKYEDTGWLDTQLPWETYTNRYGETYEGWGFNTDGKQIFWYNEQAREVNDTSSPIYKTQYRYRERYIIYY